MSLLTVGKDSLTLDGQPFYLASGDMHYFRFFPGGWRRRLELMKDFGLTAVQTYVPWNAHEPRPGEFCFEGRLDLAAFLRLCGEVGLKVMLRPSGYMCSEWDMGGLPSWLLKTPGITLRSTDPAFMEPMKRYMKRLCQEFVPLLSTNGGPVIAVAVENEYGSYADDKEYLRVQADILRECGVDVPLYAADGYSTTHLENGAYDHSVWHGVDYRIESRTAIAALRAFQPDRPPLVCEYWDGRSMHWQDEFHHRAPGPVAEGYKQALELGAYVNFYMFAGGTNFGFMHGANYGCLAADLPGAKARYISGMTSYDVDALVSEHGVPTEKYYACRRVLDAYLGKPGRPDDPPAYEAQAPAPVTLSARCDLFANLEALTETRAQRPNVCPMEELDQDYGFILYSTQVERVDGRLQELHIDGLCDRAQVYLDGRYLGACMRDQPAEPIRFTVKEGGSRLDILVENMGRINFGWEMHDRKGILDKVMLLPLSPEGHATSRCVLLNWTIRTLPMRDVSVLREKTAAGDSPAFWRGRFTAKPGVDTFLDMRAWHKGNVWVNGFNLGRYWEAGPQQALYLPGELLREDNEIVVLELMPDREPVVSFRDQPLLVGNLCGRPVHEYPAET